MNSRQPPDILRHPDAVHGLVLGRDEVAQRIVHTRAPLRFDGCDFEGANLSGLDLSGA